MFVDDHSVVKKLVIISAIIFVTIVITSLSLLSDEFAVARLQSKVHFTKTMTSSQDPGIGWDEYQFALILSPNQGSLYQASFTYTSNEPLEIIVLHEITKEDAKGQPTWTVDGNTIYGMSIIEPPAKAGSFDFTGAALAVRSKNPFTVTASVDGWIRGQPVELVIQKFEIKEQSFALPDSHIPITIPMTIGFYEKETVYYIITDSSNKTLADRITTKQGWAVQFAPKLRWAPPASQDNIYVFTNGLKGDGIYGFQDEVFSSTPAQTDTYSPLRTVITVSWKDGQRPQVLNSVEDILKAEKERRINLKSTNVTINAPQIVWPKGQLFTRNDTTVVTDEISFEKGQVVEINKDTKKVTFVAHRGWGSDGRTVYYIIPDATPDGPAELMGVPSTPKLSQILSSAAFVDMYQFKNGFKGPGQLGFQASIINSKLDESYVPICRVSIVEWKEPTSASVLETISDINKKKSEGSIFVTLARPLSSDHIINCPLVEPKE